MKLSRGRRRARAGSLIRECLPRNIADGRLREPVAERQRLHHFVLTEPVLPECLQFLER
jgi:hypothetical protein